MLKYLSKIHTKQFVYGIIAICCAVSSCYFDLRLPEFMTEITVFISSGSDVNVVSEMALSMAFCVFMSAFFSVSCAFFAAKCAAGLARISRCEMFNHVMDFGRGEIDKFSVSSLITRATNDFNQVEMFIVLALQLGVKSPVMAVWAIVKILGTSWQLSLVTACFVLALCVLIVTTMILVIPNFKIIQVLSDKINLIEGENLSGINVVHAFNAEDYQNKKFNVINTRITQKYLYNQKRMATLMPLIQFSVNSLGFVIYWVGALLLINTALESRVDFFGEIVAFSSYATVVLMSFILLIVVILFYPQAKVSADRIVEVLNQPISLKQGDKKITDYSNYKSLKLKYVWFRYPKASKFTLRDISFDISENKTLAIIGSTGSGKSTIVNMISRMMDVTQGVVYLGDTNIKEFKFEDLYKIIGLVTQNAISFAGTVRDNLCLGLEGSKVDDDTIKKYLDIAQASSFKDKLDDNISQGGKNLSGGQRQRLSIARTLIREPQIIIFDDSFSALDYKTDQALRNALNSVNATKIIVAQRIGTIKDADKILVIDNGCIVGQGRHEELLKSNRVYREIASSQLSEEELGGEA